jgi:hypothetical protein
MADAPVHFFSFAKLPLSRFSRGDPLMMMVRKTIDGWEVGRTTVTIAVAIVTIVTTLVSAGVAYASTQGAVSAAISQKVDSKDFNDTRRWTELEILRLHVQDSLMLSTIRDNSASLRELRCGQNVRCR